VLTAGFKYSFRGATRQGVIYCTYWGLILLITNRSHERGSTGLRLDVDNAQERNIRNTPAANAGAARMNPSIQARGTFASLPLLLG
jgi:hypothetical protein